MCKKTVNVLGQQSDPAEDVADIVPFKDKPAKMTVPQFFRAVPVGRKPFFCFLFIKPVNKLNRTIGDFNGRKTPFSNGAPGIEQRRNKQ